MYSMTGFGRAEVMAKQGKLLVEISTVNNRFLEFSLRLPRQFSALEPKIKQLVNESLERGKVNIYMGWEESAETDTRYRLNMEAARAYAKQLRKLGKELKLSAEVTASDLLQLPEVVETEDAEVDLETLWIQMKKGVEGALTSLTQMRKAEGLAMAEDMKKRLTLMSRLVSDIERDAAKAVPQYAEKLRARIAELLSSPVRDSTRIEEEIAIFAERTDITEECVRFRSHVDQYQKALKEKNAVGRRLNFILQEMNREANTMGSKSADFGVVSHVITIKEELEKLRELVQNVE